jgi:hypothetical protein
MNEVQKFVRTALGHVASYAIHFALVAVAAAAARWGFHISIPVFPGSLATWSVLGLVKVALSNLGRSWHSGRLAAELETQAKQDVSQFFNDIVAAAEGKGAKAA